MCIEFFISSNTKAYDVTKDSEAVKVQADTMASDHMANKLIRPYQGMLARPTIVMAFTVLSSFILVITLAANGIIPLWAGLILNSLVLYATHPPLYMKHATAILQDVTVLNFVF